MPVHEGGGVAHATKTTIQGVLSPVAVTANSRVMGRLSGWVGRSVVRSTHVSCMPCGTIRVRLLGPQQTIIAAFVKGLYV